VSRLLEKSRLKKINSCVKIIRKIKAKEDQFWNEDILFDPSE
jgi:hypothetical protein